MTIDVEQRRDELLVLRERMLTAAAHLVADDEETGELNSAAGDQHLGDHASDMLDREVDESLGENTGHVIREIDEALAQIEAGTYGLCSACGAPIPDERLAAVPYATLCLDDRRKLERA